MTENTILYTLSTLAQTCAALAAFVGAVGVYRLQSLREEHARNEQALRGYAQAFGLTRDEAARETMERILEVVTADVTGQPFRSQSPATIEDAREAVVEWRSFPGHRRRAVTALLIFEGWHLFLIAATLIGFNYVNGLTTWAGTFWMLWAVAVVTVVVTMGSVVAWTMDPPKSN